MHSKDAMTLSSFYLIAHAIQKSIWHRRDASLIWYLIGAYINATLPPSTEQMTSKGGVKAVVPVNETTVFWLEPMGNTTVGAESPRLGCGTEQASDIGESPSLV